LVSPVEGFNDGTQVKESNLDNTDTLLQGNSPEFLFIGPRDTKQFLEMLSSSQGSLDVP
jgi:hypothetical protein